MVVTQEILNKGLSNNGSYNIKQLKQLLPEWEFNRPEAWPSKGWKSRLIGKDLPKEKIDKFLELKNKHLKVDKIGSLF